MQGEMKLQIDRMIAKFFSSLPVDEQLNFSVAVTVMSVQRKWRQRMKAHKVSQSGLLLPRVFFSRVDPVHIQVPSLQKCCIYFTWGTGFSLHAINIGKCTHAANISIRSPKPSHTHPPITT